MSSALRAHSRHLLSLVVILAGWFLMMGQQPAKTRVQVVAASGDFPIRVLSMSPGESKVFHRLPSGVSVTLAVPAHSIEVTTQDGTVLLRAECQVATDCLPSSREVFPFHLPRIPAPASSAAPSGSLAAPVSSAPIAPLPVRVDIDDRASRRGPLKVVARTASGQSATVVYEQSQEGC